jgi:hypothetical protein
VVPALGAALRPLVPDLAAMHCTMR